jgi:CheY-like chemotaxis protein
VLVVDDDESTLELFAAVLNACGADVEMASSAVEALQRLAAWPADAVVSDIAMPGGDGYWLVRQIRGLTDGRLASLPVLAVTAYGREHPLSVTLAAGFADRLQKPVEPETLCRSVAKLLGR